MGPRKEQEDEGTSQRQINYLRNCTVSEDTTPIGRAECNQSLGLASTAPKVFTFMLSHWIIEGLSNKYPSA